MSSVLESEFDDEEFILRVPPPVLMRNFMSVREIMHPDEINHDYFYEDIRNCVTPSIDVNESNKPEEENEIPPEPPQQ
jgi:hypothetical protein